MKGPLRALTTGMRLRLVLTVGPTTVRPRKSSRSPGASSTKWWTTAGLSGMPPSTIWPWP
eukprot:14638-Lingulodinium_polyedra.AAC.1